MSYEAKLTIARGPARNSHRRSSEASTDSLSLFDFCVILLSPSVSFSLLVRKQYLC